MLIHPAMSDEGLAVGAANALNSQKASDRSAVTTRCMDHAYLGPEFTTEEIARALDHECIPYQHYENCEKEIAGLLSQGMW